MYTEGKIANVYWEILAKIINQLYSEFHFISRRNKSYSWNMNASDEVNALLNYGYSILESQVRKNINAVGLDPFVGFLHELAESKTPLVHDIQELYRWLIDLSVIQLLEEKKLKKSDFIVTENYHLRLKPRTAKMLVEKISLNFNMKTKYKNGWNSTYQTILFDNIQHLANFILDRVEILQFKIPNMEISANDTLSIRNQILSMSPNERKKLGINKSTLWYQKKNIIKGQRIKVYDKVLKILNGLD